MFGLTKGGEFSILCEFTELELFILYCSMDSQQSTSFNSIYLQKIKKFVTFN